MDPGPVMTLGRGSQPARRRRAHADSHPPPAWTGSGWRATVAERNPRNLLSGRCVAGARPVGFGTVPLPSAGDQPASRTGTMENAMNRAAEGRVKSRRVSEVVWNSPWEGRRVARS